MDQVSSNVEVKIVIVAHVLYDKHICNNEWASQSYKLYGDILWDRDETVACDKEKLLKHLEESYEVKMLKQQTR